MTDIPRVGFLCTGANHLELASSIYCAKHLMGTLRESGYAAGGYYTAVLVPLSAEVREAAKEKLIQLSLYNDLIITTGCDGFREGDIMPDLTKEISQQEAPCFALQVCGAQAGQPKNAGTDGLQEKRSIPSRGTAGITGHTLILNLPGDYEIAKRRLFGMLPAIHFAVMGLSGKSAYDAKSIEQSFQLEKEVERLQEQTVVHRMSI